MFEKLKKEILTENCHVCLFFFQRQKGNSSKFKKVDIEKNETSLKSTKRLILF
jgi:hypothetical protein